MAEQVFPGTPAFERGLALDGVSRRQFFFQDGGPPRAHSVHYAWAPVRAQALSLDEASAGASNSWLSSTLRTPSGWRSYATSRSADERQLSITVWESADGSDWTPVDLRQAPGGATNQIWFDGLPGDQTSVAGPSVVPLRDGRWRMYFWKHREGHLRYLVAESEDALRWRVEDVNRPVLYHPADGGTWKLAEGLAVEDIPAVALSPAEILSRKRLWSNDASRVHYNALLDRYECYSVWLHPAIPDRRVDVDNAPGVHRMIQRRLSEDGQEWSDPELVLFPDERDPWDLQFYFMTVQPLNDFLVGCVGHYRVEDGQQTMDTDLAFSTDGVRWHRPLSGGWIPRPEGVHGIYGGDWLDLGGEWMCPYAAVRGPHNARSFEMQMMGAVVPANRLVGVEAGLAPGGFMTRPFFLREPVITVDADIRGWLRAELCDVFGRKIPGFHLMDSRPVSGDSAAHAITWKGDTSAHRHEFLRLRLEFSGAVVYSAAF